MWRSANDKRDAFEAGIREDTLRLVRIDWISALTTLTALFMLASFGAADQKSAPDSKSVTAASKPALARLPKIWHIDAKHKDFRVEVTDDLFKAEWVNIPPDAAKQGAYIHTECRRVGTKWVGTSSVYQAAAVSKDPAVKTTKMCHLTIRFEVDSITPQKITFHSEAMRNFDPAKCQLLQTAWEEFAWVPKK
jgi:hypothetical protein